jgi:hypothetical protein
MTDRETEGREPSLSIGDLRAVVQLIDICARRGAFDGKELESVGALRTRFADFLRFNSPVEEAQTSEGDGGVEETQASEVTSHGDPTEPGEG